MATKKTGKRGTVLKIQKTIRIDPDLWQLVADEAKRRDLPEIRIIEEGIRALFERARTKP